MTRLLGDWSAAGVRRRLVRLAPGVLALVALFAFYASFRQRYVGACDWYGYYAEARLFLQGRLTMPLDLDVSRYPAAAPLAYEELNGRAVPQYPPGLPLLLAAGAVFGVEFFVTPLCAVLSVWVMYLLLARRVSRFVAVLMSAVWAFCPIVVWGAGNVMSDLPAALALMACYCLLDRDRPALAGAVFVFAVAIRPSNALFGLLLLPLFGDWRRFLRFAAPAAVGGAVYGLYNAVLFGAPWRTGYQGGFHGFALQYFPHHFPYYARELLLRLTPALLLPALLAVVRRRDRSLFFLGWFLLFWVLYSFWWAGADAWWYMRFLLPGLPGVFVLAADGWEEIRGFLERTRPRWHVGVQSAFGLAAAALIAASVTFCHERQCFAGTTGRSYYEISMSARRALPHNALIGAFNLTGALRLYGGFDTFRVPYPGARRLVEDTLPTGRPVYLLLERSLREDGTMRRLLQEFEVSPEIALEGRPDDRVVQVLGRRQSSPQVEAGSRAQVLFVPLAASHAGRTGPSWTTEVWVHNLTARPATLDGAVLEPGVDGSAAVAAPRRLGTVPPRGVVRLQDVLGSAGRPITGALFLSATSTGGAAAVVAVSARNSTPAPAGRGRLGQGVVAVRAGTSAHTAAPGVHVGADWRTNLGVLNTSPLPIVVAVSVLDAGGVARASATWRLLPYEPRLRPASSLGVTSLDGGTADFVLQGAGSFQGFISVVDNHSGDSEYVPAQ